MQPSVAYDWLNIVELNYLTDKA